MSHARCDSHAALASVWVLAVHYARCVITSPAILCISLRKLVCAWLSSVTLGWSSSATVLVPVVLAQPSVCERACLQMRSLAWVSHVLVMLILGCRLPLVHRMLGTSMVTSIPISTCVAPRRTQNVRETANVNLPCVLTSSG